jgi:hypothetical protein
VLKATDRLGHRLRGEPEPPVVVRPESAYRWLRSSGLEPAATVTVVTGSSPEQVVAAFGGHPARPVPADEALTAGLDPWVAVLPSTAPCWPSSSTAIRARTSGSATGSRTPVEPGAVVVALADQPVAPGSHPSAGPSRVAVSVRICT